MPQITKKTDQDVIFNVNQSVLDSLVRQLQSCNLPVPERRYVGFCEPPTDCCPDLVVWSDGIEADDLSLGSGQTSGYYRCGSQFSMTVYVRIGLCFVDQDQDGSPLSADELSDMAKTQYQYWHCMFLNWPCNVKNGDVDELGTCDNFRLNPSRCYAEGGCAGIEFSITVPIWD